MDRLMFTYAWSRSEMKNRTDDGKRYPKIRQEGLYRSLSTVAATITIKIAHMARKKTAALHGPDVFAIWRPSMMIRLPSHQSSLSVDTSYCSPSRPIKSTRLHVPVAGTTSNFSPAMYLSLGLPSLTVCTQECVMPFCWRSKTIVPKVVVRLK